MVEVSFLSHELIFSSVEYIWDSAIEMVHPIVEVLFFSHEPNFSVLSWNGIVSVLAAWFRLKYAHLTIDALASSAPILHLDDNAPTNSSASIVTKDFRVCSFIC